MWYEILAPALIMAGLFKLPDLIAPVLCKAINGKPALRSDQGPMEVGYILRDIRLTGDAYKDKGLESIRDN